LCGAVGIFACLVSLAFYFPPLFLGLKPDNRIFDLAKMAEHPLRRDLYEPILCFRLTVPLLAHVVGARSVAALYAIQLAFNAAFLGSLFAVLCQRTTKSLAFLATLLFALSQAGQTGNTWFGVQDSVAFLCVCILMLSTSLWTGLAAVAGLFADERIVLAYPFICI